MNPEDTPRVPVTPIVPYGQQPTEDTIPDHVVTNLRNRLRNAQRADIIRNVHAVFRTMNGDYDGFSGVCMGSYTRHTRASDVKYLATLIVPDPAYAKTHPHTHHRSVMQKWLDDRSEKAVNLLAYVNWILTDDLFGNIFLTKDAYTGMLDGFFINTGCPRWLAQTGMIMLRRIREFPIRINVWAELCERGVPERSAALLAELVEIESADNRQGDKCDFNHKYGHYAIPRESLTWGAVMNNQIITTDYHSESQNLPYARGWQSGSYRPFLHGHSRDTILTDRFLTAFKKTSKTNMIKDFFGREIAQRAAVDYKDMAKFLVSQIPAEYAGTSLKECA